jgi:hypothetical protein
MIEAGFKRAAIKQIGAGPVKAGDSVILRNYTDKKEKQKKKLVKVTGAWRIAVIDVLPNRITMTFESMPLSQRMARKLVKKCGYRSLDQFIQLITTHHQLPYHGQVITW